jgi:hypothetical protein
MTPTKLPDPVKDYFQKLWASRPGTFPTWTEWSHDTSTYNETRGGFRCEACSGGGRVVAPWETPCPVEGHKLSDRIDCDKCQGTGIGTETEARARYRRLKAAHDTRKRNFKAAYHYLLHIISKLEYADQEFIWLWKMSTFPSSFQVVADKKFGAKK